VNLHADRCLLSCASSGASYVTDWWSLSGACSLFKQSVRALLQFDSEMWIDMQTSSRRRPVLI